MGVSRGYLAKILSGQVEPYMRHLFEILEAVEVSPADFLAAVYPARSAPGSYSRIVLKRLAAVGTVAAIDEPVPGRADEEDDDDLVDPKLARQVRRILRGMLDPEASRG
jgi:transcriptional regulator with XRE-family HTH domain